LRGIFRNKNIVENEKLEEITVWNGFENKNITENKKIKRKNSWGHI
jgi:hypothetical protein